MPHGLELRELDPADAAASTLLGRRAFGFHPGPYPEPSLPQGSTNHGAFVGGRLVGQAFDLHDEQWWGGRLLRAADIAGVAVAAEARGQGVARALMGRMLEAARERGAVVSALFPSISTVYRRLGWASVGSVDTWSVPTLSLPRTGVPGLTVREGTDADLVASHELYRTVAAANNGMLSRDELRFQRTELPDIADGLTVVADGDSVVAYAIWTRGPRYGPDGALTVHDVLALNQDAARSLLAVLSSWHTVVPELRMRLLGGDAVTDLISVETRSRKSVGWMHRPVDVAGAVVARGWPAGVSGRASFTLTDDLAPWNAGAWELSVSDGAGELKRCGDASVALSVAGFASLFCGVASPEQVAAAGHATGPASDLAALGVLAVGTPPRVLNTF
ncbi:MAG TPA: GNAT family N-acetyltransferase [Pseudonocardiaceae bacterium]|nr:GNAT family N-acetyltransferase [Pseudonocardiaceae bacterium]